MNRRGMASAMVLVLMAVAAATANLAYAVMLTRRREGTAYQQRVQLREYAWAALELDEGTELELDGCVLRRLPDRAEAVRGETRWVLHLQAGRVVREDER